ncbi:MAG: FAD-dependent oxidoreductase [Candidatus Helarchaeota archaeon]
MVSKNKIGAAMVVGAGIGGIQASLDLADLGFKVYLIERNPSIGGIMAALDKTFPTNDCSLCILAPKMVEAYRHPNIDLYSYTEVEGINGEAGNFEVTLLKKARYVDPSKCKSCASCAQKCPARIPDEYNQKLNQRRAVYIPFPQAVPSVFLIDKDNCLFFKKGICKICEKFCEAKAIDYEQKDEQITLNVGAIVLATGSDTFDPSILPQYGYGKYKNVVTSMEFERILNASGPFKGEVIRPSDNKHPKKILWINCIGSRNKKIGKGYCSSVCCMYSIKQAVIAKEHAPDLECNVHYIDMRTVGKGFEEYYLRAQENNIKFLKGRIGILEEDIHTSDLIVTFENTTTGEFTKEIYDMIVLSVGLTPSDYGIELAQKFGIELNNYNFCSTSFSTPLTTNKEGIFVCGTYSGPKDIPETVAEASGAAAKVSSLLASERNTLISTKEYPPELPVESEEPRIGAFICNCGINIGGIVNVSEVTEFANTLPNVVYAEENMYSCSQDTQDKIKNRIAEHKLNRVVVASCTPRTHESLFQNTIREAGLNPFLFQFVNIREQCSWVHMHEPEKATEKAKDLVAMGVAKAGLLNPIHESAVNIVHSGLVIGGGIAGMTAALEIANQGYPVSLIEKEPELGGLVRSIHYILYEGDPQQFLKDLIKKVQNNDKISIFTGAEITDIQGYVGNFKVDVNQNGTKKQIDTGVIIVATGGKEYVPIEYLYGTDPRILTQHELEQKIVTNEINAKTIVMIQCVGSRNDERPNCSRICCSQAIKNSLKLKEKDPNINIVVLHKDIRTYGFREDYYLKARESGVIFLRYDKDDEPEVNIVDGNLSVTVSDVLSNEHIAIEPDLVVLSAAFLPSENKELSQMLKVPLEQSGFFLEAHVKLRPLDFATDGIFLCGAAQWPKFINESVAQAKGAAARAGTILAKDKIKVGGVTADVDLDLCSGCETCIKVCPYGAIRKNENDEIEIIGAVCKGCGVCGASCPEKAIFVRHFTNEQIISQIIAPIGGE